VVNQYTEIKNWRSSEGEIKCGVIFDLKEENFVLKKREGEREKEETCEKIYVKGRHIY
jgi:hypothetical protein